MRGPDEAWGNAVDHAERSRLILLLGASDTGKTWLAALLADRLAREGPVAVVDTDLGQSTIGPPTTLGLARVTSETPGLSRAEVLALSFVGSTSPPGHLLPVVVGARRLVDQARARGLGRVIVDTSGLVHGDLGRVLKQHKIDVLGPDLVICLQRDGECEHILAPYGRGAGPGVLRLTPAPVARLRSQEERRRYRERLLERYFAGATLRSVSLDHIVVRQPAFFVGSPPPPLLAAELSTVLGEAPLWIEARGGEVTVITLRAVDLALVREASLRARTPVVVYGLDELLDSVVGLEGADGFALGLGALRSIDLARREMDLLTPVDVTGVSAVALGREKYRPLA